VEGKGQESSHSAAGTFNKRLTAAGRIPTIPSGPWRQIAIYLPAATPTGKYGRKQNEHDGDDEPTWQTKQARSVKESVQHTGRHTTDGIGNRVPKVTYWKHKYSSE
jgi:hypothetical protein